ncbi:Protein required for meiotic chromosome segregation [Plasmopara halstedii]|uniref:Protein required for meiotic chromosome segregation n=1 Tax=Plasmopara halstedii TaxID=4781 RepID=A0A0P1AGK8_PLAHL|nr:Protein required for meiotic chromosome segregation [Plasmopara halstedii]CEG39914.1 Protein required for meiotic chromosome segregation [Plasmopara halstedii]|eukprot:XP_024576283.1 Protein required for meiotic chromosome segregation [Plasmopara halstedii]
MESSASTTKAAADAVSQALEEIQLPPMRKPSIPIVYTKRQTSSQDVAMINTFYKFQSAPFRSISFGMPWNNPHTKHSVQKKKETIHVSKRSDTESKNTIGMIKEPIKADSDRFISMSGKNQDQWQQREQNCQQNTELDVKDDCKVGSSLNFVTTLDKKSIESVQQVEMTLTKAPFTASPRSALRRKQAQLEPQSLTLDISSTSSLEHSKTLLSQESNDNVRVHFDNIVENCIGLNEKELEHPLSLAPSTLIENSSPRSIDNPDPSRIASRQEDEFDFAILLKPSKFEESIDFQPHDLEFPDKWNPVTGECTNDRATIVRRIRQTGLHVKRLLSLDGKQSLLKVRAPQRILELGAERLRLRKKRKFDHVWMVFTCQLRTSFADFDSTRQCLNFLDREKQSIVHALLTASESEGGAGLNETCSLAARYVLQMYPLHKQDLARLQTQWVTFWRTTLFSTNATPTIGCNILDQPLDNVAQYFGERVTFYFAWMELYTRWLVVPSIAGVLLFSLQVSSHHLDHPAAPGYALFMALWTSAFLIAWRRRAATLAYHWGTWGYEDEEVTRPAFYGDSSGSLHDLKDRNDCTPRERHYALWKRAAKYSLTFPCVATSIVAVVTVAYVAFSTRDRLEADSLKTKHEAALIGDKIQKTGTITLDDLRALAHLGVRWDFWIYLLLTPLLYGLFIPLLDAAFTRAARCLNNWENHRTESRYQSHLILKVFSFRFVHVFASLYYYAFAPHTQSVSSLKNEDGTKSDGMVRVALQLASFMVTGQLWKNVMETLFPFIQRRLQARSKKRASNEKFKQSTIFNSLTTGPCRPRSTARKRMPEIGKRTNAVIHAQCVRLEQASDRAWEEANLKHYDTFEDYTEMLVQFGYVSFFSLAFPLAPLLALLNNLIELRTDAFKLCHTRQRPLAHKASGIGVWLHVLQIMSVLAVVTNCFQLAYSTSLFERAFPFITSTEKVWIVFGIEHFLLVIQLWMTCAVPSVPRDILEKLRKERELAKYDSAQVMARLLESEG